MSDGIKIGNHITELTGVGTEYLVINGELIARFYEGSLISDTKSVNRNEKTVSLT